MNVLKAVYTNNKILKINILKIIFLCFFNTEHIVVSSTVPLRNKNIT
jgi:hypothetical protein